MGMKPLRGHSSLKECTHAPNQIRSASHPVRLSSVFGFRRTGRRRQESAGRNDTCDDRVAGEQVNINTVDEAALIRGLNGVGEAKARAILEYRAAHGPFVSVDQLLEVKGVGPALLEKNRARIVIE